MSDLENMNSSTRMSNYHDLLAEGCPRLIAWKLAEQGCATKTQVQQFVLQHNLYNMRGWGTVGIRKLRLWLGINEPIGRYSIDRIKALYERADEIEKACLRADVRALLIGWEAEQNKLPE